MRGAAPVTHRAARQIQRREAIAVTVPPNNLTTDQRGLPRLAGAHVDIGAYEAQ